MKKLLFALAGIIALSVSLQASGPAICDTQQSDLCAGLGQVFAFEETADEPRWDENRSVAFLEADGQDVASAAGKLDTNAASFVGTDGNYLWIPRAGSAINGSTVAFWIYPTSAATEQIVISADEATKHGPYLSLVPSAGAVKVKATAHYGDGRGEVSVTSTSTLTLNAWHLVIWGYDRATAVDFATTSLTGQVMYVQLDNGPRYSVGLNYFPISGPYNDLVVGQRKGTGVGYTMPYSGRIDQLTLAGRIWDTVDATEFYAAGGGKVYPFVPTSFDSLNAGLVAFWNMDEASNTTRQDSVNQNDAADATSGMAQSSTSKLGFSALHDAASERLSVTSNGSVEYSGDFTVGGWVRQTAHTSAGTIAGKVNFTTSKSEWYLWHTGTGGTDKIWFRVADSSGWYGGTHCHAETAAAPIADNTWYFIVADYTASTKTCRVRINNGTVYSGVATTLPAVQSAVNVTFTASHDGSSGVAGYVDEWFLYKRVLTAQQMTDLYNSGNGRTYPF